MRDGAIGLGCGAFGALLIWMALTDLMPFDREVVGGAKLVTLNVNAFRAFGVGLAFLLLAALAFAFQFSTSILSGRDKGKPTPQTMRWLGYGLALAVVLTLGGLLSAPLAGLVADQILVGKGYHACPSSARRTMRWARTEGCP